MPPRSTQSRCKVCKRLVSDFFNARLQHVLKYHPEMVLKKTMDIAFNPGGPEEFGAYIGELFRKRLGL